MSISTATDTQLDYVDYNNSFTTPSKNTETPPENEKTIFNKPYNSFAGTKESKELRSAGNGFFLSGIFMVFICRTPINYSGLILMGIGEVFTGLSKINPDHTLAHKTITILPDLTSGLILNGIGVGYITFIQCSLPVSLLAGSAAAVTTIALTLLFANLIS